MTCKVHKVETARNEGSGREICERSSRSRDFLPWLTQAELAGNTFSPKLFMSRSDRYLTTDAALPMIFQEDLP
jgi:hypothetical protein